MADKALLAEQVNPNKGDLFSKNGGIDLTFNNAILIQNNGQSIKFQLDPSQIARLQNSLGFFPIVISIKPVTNLLNWLCHHNS